MWERSGAGSGFLALFAGGVLIFPLSLLIARLVFRAPASSKGNPLERLALESTFMLFAGMLLAWCFLRVAPELTLPAMAVAIGVRYLIFRTVYGNALYWALGGVLAVVGGVTAAQIVALPVNTALVVGAIEVVFAGLIFLTGRTAKAA